MPRVSASRCRPQGTWRLTCVKGCGDWWHKGGLERSIDWRVVEAAEPYRLFGYVAPSELHCPDCSRMMTTSLRAKILFAHCDNHGLWLPRDGRAAFEELGGWTKMLAVRTKECKDRSMIKLALLGSLAVAAMSCGKAKDATATAPAAKTASAPAAATIKLGDASAYTLVNRRWQKVDPPKRDIVLHADGTVEVINDKTDKPWLDVCGQAGRQRHGRRQTDGRDLGAGCARAGWSSPDSARRRHPVGHDRRERRQGLARRGWRRHRARPAGWREVEDRRHRSGGAADRVPRARAHDEDALD